MSLELWQQAKTALAEVMALAEDQRDDFLQALRLKSPDVHEEVVSLMASQVAAEQAGFLGDPDDTRDQYRTETYDPNRTRGYDPAAEELHSISESKRSLDNLVGEDYELEKKIGQGGMGVVYKAYHRSLRRTVALKIITAGGLRDEIDIARFHIEAEAAARLDHPGIIPVYDVGEYKGNHYYAMAYVEGSSLSEHVGAKKKTLPPRRAAELMEQVCQAVQYAHDRAVIHRDLKPANIMLENGVVPRLADFGLAKNMHEDEGLTMTGQVMGTPSYMAPEQATGKLDQISNRTDVYSLGATLYALLAGRPPFSGGTMLETIRQVVRSDPEALTNISRAIPQDLQTICEKCLQKDPKDRYASAEEVANDLRRYLDGFPISARPLGPWARLIRLCQRNPVESSLVGVAAAAMIIGTIVSTRYGIEASRQAETAQAALAEAKANAQTLRESIKKTFILASEDVLAQEPGMQAARAVLLESAQRYYEELVEQAPRDAASLAALAESQFMLSKVQMALGKDEQALKTLSSALQTQQDLAKTAPEDALLLTALAKTHNQLATLAQSHWQALTQLHDLEQLTDDKAAAANLQLEKWKQHSAEVIRLREKVVKLQPDHVESKRLYANALMNEGSAISIRGFANNDLKEQDRARKQLQEAQEVRISVLSESPDEHLVRRDLGRGYYNMAFVELSAVEQVQIMADPEFESRLQLCNRDLTQAITAYQKIPATERSLDTQLELARCYRQRADAKYRLNEETDTIVPDYRQAEALLQKLTDRNPKVYHYRSFYAETQLQVSHFWFDEGQEELGINQFAKCRETLLQALRIDPLNQSAVDNLVLFTFSVVDPLLEYNKDDKLATQLLQQTAEKLLALKEESEEYHHLQPSIEVLETRIHEIKAQQEAVEATKDLTYGPWRHSLMLAVDRHKVASSNST